MPDYIEYKKGYKYQLWKPYSIQTVVKGYVIHGDFLKLDFNGLLTCEKGYAWDGASGPAFDTDTFMRASLVHDAFYQLMRLGQIDRSHRGYADRLMKQICLDDEMWFLRAHWCYQAVKNFSKQYSEEEFKRQVLIAPKIDIPEPDIGTLEYFDNNKAS